MANTITKLYIYQIPRDFYHADRRKKHDPKYLSRRWETHFETTDYNEILEYINGMTVVIEDSDGTEHCNTPDPVYRVLEQTVVVQEGQLVSPYDDFQKEVEKELLARSSTKNVKLEV